MRSINFSRAKNDNSEKKVRQQRLVAETQEPIGANQSSEIVEPSPEFFESVVID